MLPFFQASYESDDIWIFVGIPHWEKSAPFDQREKTASHRLPRWLDFPILPILERYFIRWWDAHRAIIESLSFQRHRKYSQTIWQKFPKDIIIFCRYREHRFVLCEKLEKFFQSCKSTHYNCEFDRHQIQYKYIDKSTRCCIMVRNNLIKGAA